MHILIDPILNHYIDFSGRASREEFWVFILGCAVIAFVLYLLNYNLALTIFSLALLAPIISITVRRLHDINYSGFWVLLLIAPIVLYYALVIFLAYAVNLVNDTYAENIGLIFAVITVFIYPIILLLFVYWLLKPSQLPTQQDGVVTSHTGSPANSVGGGSAG